MFRSHFGIFFVRSLLTSVNFVFEKDMFWLPRRAYLLSSHPNYHPTTNLSHLLSSRSFSSFFSLHHFNTARYSFRLIFSTYPLRISTGNRLFRLIYSVVSPPIPPNQIPVQYFPDGNNGLRPRPLLFIVRHHSTFRRPTVRFTDRVFK